jgi:hypothetical protein
MNYVFNMRFLPDLEALMNLKGIVRVQCCEKTEVHKRVSEATYGRLGVHKIQLECQ